MPVNIPWEDEPQFEVSVELASEVFNLSFIYSDSFQNWVMSIFKPDNTPLLLGVKLTLNTPLLVERTNILLPKGSFIVNSDSEVEKITYDSMVSGETYLVFIEGL